MKYLTGLFFIMITSLIYGQPKINNSKEPILSSISNRDSSIYLADYQIDPKNKQVSIKGRGGKRKIGIQMIYTPDPRINFDTTALVVLGQQILFREYLPPECDPDKIKIITSYQSATVFSCKNYLYIYGDRQTRKIADISGYKIIDNFFYLDKKGDIYTLTNNLEKVVGLPHLDLNSLKHLAGHYITDKNGLYFLQWGYGYKRNGPVAPSVMLESSNGKIITPKIISYNIIYNNHIYVLGEGIFKLDINVDKMGYIGEQEGYMDAIFDDKNIYLEQSNVYPSDKDTISPMMNFFSRKGIKWESILPINFRFVAKTDTSMVYIPLGNIHSASTNVLQASVIKTSGGYYMLNRGLYTTNPHHIKELLIFSIDTRQYEDFDITLFKILYPHFYIYKNHLFYDDLPVKDSLDIKRLVNFTQNGIETNYLTDGTTLLNIGSIGYYSTTTISGIDWTTFQDRMATGVDTSKIQAINKDILIDNQYIYNFGERLPINKLGMKLKICK